MRYIRTCNCPDVSPFHWYDDKYPPGIQWSAASSARSEAATALRGRLNKPVDIESKLFKMLKNPTQPKFPR